MANRKQITLLSLPIIGLTACIQQVNPIWETYFSTSDNNNNIEWLNHLTLDNTNDLLLTGGNITTGANRNEDGFLAKYNQQGSQIWATKYELPASAENSTLSNEKLIESRVDDDGYIYSVGRRFETINGATQISSFVMKVDQDGNFIWTTKISDNHDVFDLEVFENSVYVTGFATQRLSKSGSIELTIKNQDRAWDIEVDIQGNMYVASKHDVVQYSPSGTLNWQHNHTSTELSYRANIELDETNNNLVLLQADGDSHYLLQSFSMFGDSNWNKAISITNDNSLLGEPKLIVEGSSIWFALSNDSQSKVGKVSSTGRNQWTFTEQQGPIHGLGKLANGQVAVTGAGHSVLLDSQGKQLANNDTARAASNTTGSIVVDGNKMFVGTSVSSSAGGIGVHLAMFEQ
jgi:hypothetical protein